MKFLHCSDIHLGKKQAGIINDYSKKRYDDFFDSFSYIIDYTIDNEIDALIISGDLFDKKEITPDILSRTIVILNKLKENLIPVIVIEGNHDNISIENDSWLLYLENAHLIKRPYFTYEDEKYSFFPIQFNNINFYGLGYNGAFTNDTVSALAEYLEDNSLTNNNVILVHTAIGSDGSFPGTVNSTTISKLTNFAMYVAGGHFHSFSAFPKEQPFFFVPGSLEYWDIGEFHQKKGFIIFDTETLEYNFQHSKKRNVHNINIINNYESISDFYQSFNDEIDKLIINEKEDIINIKITNSSNNFPDFVYLEELATKNIPLKVFFTTTNANNNEYSNVSNQKLLLTEIEGEIISNWEYFSKDANQSVEILQKLKSFQNENNSTSYDNFKNLFDNWIESIINNE